MTTTPTEPGIWDISGSDDEGWYIEGESKVHGWFCMELETRQEVVEQLVEMGFTSEDIDAFELGLKKGGTDG